MHTGIIFSGTILFIFGITNFVCNMISRFFYPTGLLLQFIPLYYFYFHNKKVKAVKEYRRARLHEIRQDFLEATIASKI